MSTWSVSLGHRAAPEVKTAIAHAQAHPDHDPEVVFTITLDGVWKVRVVCLECEEMMKDE